MIYKAIDYWNSPPDSYLEHHGVKGMKWGVRKAYNRISNRLNATRDTRNRINNAFKYDRGIAPNKRKPPKYSMQDGPMKQRKPFGGIDEANKKVQVKARAGASDFGKKSVQFIKDHKKEIAIGAAVVAGTALAAYGAYKVHSIRQQNMAAVGEYLKSHDVRLGEGKLMSTATYGGNSHMQEFTRQSSSIKKSILGPTLNTNIHTTTRWRSPTIDNHGNWSWDKYKTTINSLDKTTTIGRGGSTYRDDLFLKSKNKYMRRAGKLSMKKNANYYKDFMSMYK